MKHLFLIILFSHTICSFSFGQKITDSIIQRIALSAKLYGESRQYYEMYGDSSTEVKIPCTFIETESYTLNHLSEFHLTRESKSYTIKGEYNLLRFKLAEMSFDISLKDSIYSLELYGGYEIHKFPENESKGVIAKVNKALQEIFEKIKVPKIFEGKGSLTQDLINFREKVNLKWPAEKEGFVQYGGTSAYISYKERENLITINFSQAPLRIIEIGGVTYHFFGLVILDPEKELLEGTCFLMTRSAILEEIPLNENLLNSLFKIVI